MTIIKQKAVVSERHAENVRKYLNSKDAVLRDGWNMEYHDKWFAEMARTRARFGHDIAARRGFKNTLMYHQVLLYWEQRLPYSIRYPTFCPLLNDTCRLSVRYVNRSSSGISSIIS